MCLVRHVAWYACGVGRRDSRHEGDSPFQTITKVPRILDVSTVLMMGIHKCVNDADHHDPILETSQEHLGDLEKIVSPLKHSCLPPKKRKHIIQEGSR